MLKKARSVLAVLMAVLLAAALFSACASKDESGSKVSSQAADTSSGSSEAASQDAADADSGNEVVKLRLWTVIDSANSGVPAVAEAISAITREKIGVEIEFVGKQDAEKMNLAMTSGEALDLMTTHGLPGAGLTYVVSTGYARPLDDLMNEYAQDTLAILPDYFLKCGQLNGVTYSIPHLKDAARAAGLVMRQDVLDELKIDAGAIKTWDDVHEVLLKVKEGRPDLYPLVPSWGNGGYQETLPYDDLGGGYGVLENVFEDSTTVVDLYQSDSYREFCERMFKWNKEGLFMPDVTTSTESLIGTKGFSSLENLKPGKAQEVSHYDEVGGYALIDLTTPYTYTNMVGGSSFIIPNISENPEKAMQLLNLMFTDPEISTLFVDGIEGVNYVYTDDTRTAIKTPDDFDEENHKYSRVDWAWPNMRITPPWETVDADVYDQLAEFCDSARTSPALGFRFDTANVMNEISACDNVVAKYNTSLRWGEMDPAETLPQFISELKEAGVDTIVAEKQAQLDEWLKNNK